MKIFCKHCNNQLTSELTVVTSSEDAYETVKQATEDDPFEKSSVKSGCLFSSCKVRWWEENDQDSAQIRRQQAARYRWHQAHFPPGSSRLCPQGRNAQGARWFGNRDCFHLARRDDRQRSTQAGRWRRSAGLRLVKKAWSDAVFTIEAP